MTNDRPPRTRLDRRTAIIVVGTLAVSAAIAFPVWAWRSAEAAAGVQVIAGPGKARCNDGPKALRFADEDDDPAVVLRFDAAPGAYCQVPISVRNTSSHTVRLNDLTFPLMLKNKNGNHGPLIATKDASLVPPRGSELSNDAIFDIDGEIEPGGSWTSLILIEVNPYACLGRGIESGVTDVPRARFHVLHREHQTSSPIRMSVKAGRTDFFWSGCS